ncbi:hypothetical protein OHS81_13925 [Streptomyces sp. NBC_00400]|uniref:hypothetical protein n=1 Tax=Streptomyces sp. NBC_00400 TaxID=2975737 RepID=UPI002E1B4134
MTATARPLRAIPGPGFIARVVVSTWIDWVRNVEDAVPWLLIGHPSARPLVETRETVEDSLLGMADAMELSPPNELVPDIGDRLLIGGRITALDYGHPMFVLEVPKPSAQWRALVARGGHTCVTLCLDPISAGANRDAVEACLSRSIANGRALMGAASARVGSRP